MEISLLIAFKKILGGVSAIFLIAGILKGKSLFSIDTIRKHIKNELKKNPTKAMRLYGNDIEAYILQNYPDKESFSELLIVNAFRPLLVLILISVLDFHNFYIILFEIVLVLLIFPIELYFGDKWKNKKWYVLIVVGLWLSAFGILSYSNYLQSNENSKLNNPTTQNYPENKSIDNDTIK